MKLTFSAILLAFLFVTSMNGQSRFGVTTSVGLISNTAEVAYPSYIDDYATHEVKYLNGSAILNVGAFGMQQWGWSYLRTDLVYSTYSLNYNIMNYVNGEQVNNAKQDKFKNIDLLINAGVNSNGFRVGVGPVFHFLADYQSAFTDINSYVNKSRVLTSGFVGSIGIDFSKVSLDIRYEKSMNTIGDHVYWGENKSKFKQAPNKLAVAISYAF